MADLPHGLQKPWGFLPKERSNPPKKTEGPRVIAPRPCAYGAELFRFSTTRCFFFTTPPEIRDWPLNEMERTLWDTLLVELEVEVNGPHDSCGRLTKISVLAVGAA